MGGRNAVIRNPCDEDTPQKCPPQDHLPAQARHPAVRQANRARVCVS